MADKNEVEINISGYSYTLVGKESVEYLNELANYVSNKVSKIMCGNNNLSIKDAWILAALNSADELFKLRRECENNEKELRLKEENSHIREELLKLKKENDKLRRDPLLNKSDSDLRNELKKAYDSISNLLLERDEILEDLSKEKEKNTNLYFLLVELKSSMVQDKLQ